MTVSLLDDDDLAYLRETQAGVRPTPVDLFRRTGSVPDGMGGRKDAYADDPEPIMVRLTNPPSTTSGGDVPQNLAQKYRATDLTQVHADLTTLHVGDRLVLTDGTRYDLVSDGAITDWTTAQVAWATKV